ncbi:MAG: hypothetical protein CSA35_05975 [Dethiosulfovibrio peptidovorans]|nr:MAG: hypothetical protein CSA35_05975 [Dethiosulfovibrio peptidovorans]
MADLSSVSKTLYVPLVGRIYASHHHRDILYDPKALSVEDKLPPQVFDMKGQSEYTLLASAVRARLVNDRIQNFLKAHPGATVVNVGCGLDTSYDVNANNSARWFSLDLPEVIELRRTLFPEGERETYLARSMFDYSWIDDVKSQTGSRPVLVTAAGVLHYFHEDQVVDFLRHLAGFGRNQVLFDAVSPVGLWFSRRYVRKLGHGDAEMCFSVASARELAAKVSTGTRVLEENGRFFQGIPSNLKMATKLSTLLVEIFAMAKIIRMRVR